MKPTSACRKDLAFRGGSRAPGTRLRDNEDDRYLGREHVLQILGKPVWWIHRSPHAHRGVLQGLACLAWTLSVRGRIRSIPVLRKRHGQCGYVEPDVALRRGLPRQGGCRGATRFADAVALAASHSLADCDRIGVDPDWE